MARSVKRRDRDDQDDDGDRTDYSSGGAAKGTQHKKKRKSTASANSKGKRAARPRDSDDDLDDDSDASDNDNRRGKQAKGELSDDEKKHYIQAFVRYVLFNESHRRVLKREDIVKNVLTDGRSRHFNALLPKVQKVLKDVLGMELHELRARESASGKSQGRAWIVRSTILQPLLRHAATHRYPSFAASVPDDASTSGKKSLRAELAAWQADGEPLPGADDAAEGLEAAVMRDVKREESALYGVLGVVLALILVNGKVLGDDQLISYLRRLSLTPSTTLPLSLASPHPSSVTLSVFLNTLVKEQYLERAKTATSGATQATQQSGGGRTQGPSRTQRTNAQGDKAESGDPGLDWRWGPRADAELGEVGVAHFVERIFLAQPPRGFGHDDDDEAEEDSAAERKKKADKLRREVARAAGVKELATTETRKAAVERD
ncbi:hypothetical protein JCM9279_000847 [Rhodotorula babjevae]